MEPTDLLRELLRTASVNPPGGEEAVATRLAAFLHDAGLETKLVTSRQGRMSLVARLEGTGAGPALVLLSHSDVVPVEAERWSRDPFGGEIADGFVWGRGALDMKSIAVMHAVAAARLAATRSRPSRDVIVVMVADEEAGGDEGAGWLIDAHPELVGFADGQPPPEVIGEGAYGITGALERPIVPIALGEKTAVWFDLVARGDSGHGAMPPRRQAALNLAAAIGDVAGHGTPRVHPVMREHFATLADGATGAQAAVFRSLASRAGSAASRVLAPQLRKAGALGLLLADSVTPTVLRAGYKANVVPGEARASFDARLLPDTDVESFLARTTATARRHGVRLDRIVQKGRGPVSGRTPLLDLLRETSGQVAQGSLATVMLTPGITDLRFFRARGATAYGWTPLVLTPELLATIHGHDERIPVAGFERAVDLMSDVVERAAT